MKNEKLGAFLVNSGKVTIAPPECKKLKHEAWKAKTHLYKTKTTSYCGLKRKDVWRIVNPEIFDKISKKGRCARCQKARNKQK